MAPGVEDPWGVIELEPGEPIKIGFAAGLSGDVANLGIDIQYGAELASRGTLWSWWWRTPSAPAKAGRLWPKNSPATPRSRAW